MQPSIRLRRSAGQEAGEGQIENRLHWVLDVVMDEDRSRARKGHAPENLARLRRFALDLLRVNPDKGSIRGKIKRAGWDDAFLLTILQDP